MTKAVSLEQAVTDAVHDLQAMLASYIIVLQVYHVKKQLTQPSFSMYLSELSHVVFSMIC